MAEDDFNRLYERLVVRRTNKKKRVAVTAVTIVKETQDEETEHKKEDRETVNKKTQERDEAASQEALEALETARLEGIRRKEQQKRDANVTRAVKSLKLGRNLRGFARLRRCRPHRLAFHLVAATEHDGNRFLERYRRVKRKRSRLPRRREGRTLRLKRCMRLEGVAARLYLRRADAFRADATTTLEGRQRIVDELLFFSPINSMFQSRIGYADTGNVVPLPPQLSRR